MPSAYPVHQTLPEDYSAVEDVLCRLVVVPSLAMLVVLFVLAEGLFGGDTWKPLVM